MGGSLLELLRVRFEALFEVEEKSAGWRRRWQLRLGKLCYLLGRKFHQDLALERAASLAFASVLSLIPLGVIVFLIFHNFGQFARRIDGLVDYIVSLEQDAADQVKLREWLELVNSNLQAPLENLGAVTPFALIFLVIAASSLFRAAERNFSVVWNVEVTRGYFQKLATFWLLLTAVPIVLGLSFLPETSSALDPSLPLALLNDFVVPIVAAFFAFAILYTYLPNTRVHLDAAGVAALAASIVWVTGTQVFIYYVKNWANQNVYGALGVVPFFLVWMYYSWLVALNGCELSYCIQNFSVLEREVRYHVSHQRVRRPIHALLILERAYRGYHGELNAPTPEEVAVEFQAPLGEVHEIVETLRGAELVALDDAGRLLPSVAAERLQPLSVVEVFPQGPGFNSPPGFSERPTPVSRFIDEAREDLEKRLAGRSFLDLLEAQSVQQDRGVA